MAVRELWGISDSQRRWSPLLLVAALSVGTAAIYWQSFVSMADMWSLRTYQYAWFVYPICCAMFWHNRHRICHADIRSNWLGLVVVAVLVVTWTVASAAGIQIVEFVAATALMPAVVWAVGGPRLLRAALFPLVFAFAAVPVGESLIPALMRSTADIAAALLEFVGVPAYREGMFLTLPGGQFEVADVCSGLRYLLTGIVLATLFSYLNYRTNIKRAIFVAAVAAGVIVANGIRAFIVMYVASASNMRYFAGRDHVVFGTIMFAVLALVMMYIGSRFADAPQDRTESADAVRPAVLLSPAVVLFAAVLLLYGPFGQSIKSRSTEVAAELPAQDISLPGCTLLDGWQPAWQPVLSGPDLDDRSSWQCGAARVSVYQAAFARQHQGKELVSASNELWPKDWRRLARVSAQHVPAVSRSVDEVFVAGDATSTLVWYWYEVDGVPTNSEFRVKFAEGVKALLLRPTNSALVLLVVEGSQSYDELSERMLDVAREFG